jgi:WD40 repeat protein
MSFHASDIEVFLSYDPADQLWAEMLADRLIVEGVRVRVFSPESAPGDHWVEWLANLEANSRKLVVVCSPEYIRDERAASLLSRFCEHDRGRLLTERPVVPLLRGGYQMPAALAELRPINFNREEDYELRICQLAEALDAPPRNAPGRDTARPVVSSALSSLFRWMGAKESDARLADGVAELYRLLGFEALREQRLNDVPVDLLIQKRTGGISTRTVIECHEQLGGGVELDDLLQRQSRIRQAYPKIDCLLITAQPLDELVRASLDQRGISHITYPALLAEFVPLEGYLNKGMVLHERWQAGHWHGQDRFIRPYINSDANRHIRPALEPVSAWLRGRRGNLLVFLGDVGTGKTTLARFLAYEMAMAHRQDPLRHPMPVLVDLKDVRKETSLESILITHFREFLVEKEMGDFSLARFDHLVRQGRVVLLFDAFDEMAERMQRGVIRKNIEELIRPVRNGGKVMLTCRTHYFKDIREQEGYVGEGAIYLQEFSNDQVRRYLSKARPETAEVDWERIQDIYNLKELVARPLLLDMVVKTMPELRDVDASALYATYADFWFDREQSKGRLLDKEVKLFLMKELSWQIWDEEKHQIHFNDLLRLVKRLKGDERDFYGEDVEDVAEELRTASFLKRNDEGFYSFADHSFGEYFLACKIHESLTGPNGKGDGSELRRLLRTRLFHRKMIFFLNLLMKQHESHRALRDILTAEYEAFVSENALQILYWSGRMHGGMEEKITDTARLRRELSAYLPRGIRMSNARLNPAATGETSGFVLAGADLTEADFSGADLTGVNLNHTVLQGANFRGAVLSGALMEDLAAVHADFREAELSRAVVRRSNIRYCDFSGAIHRDVVFEDNDARGAQGLNLAGDLLRSDLIPVVQQTPSAGAHSIAIAPNGEWYACGSRDGLISLHRASDDRLLLYFDGHKRRVHSLQFSPSGALLVSGCQDGVVRLWSVSDGRQLQEIAAHRGAVRAVRFSPNGALAASAGDDRGVRLWRVDEGKALRSFGGFEGHTSSVHALHFSPDGRLLASAGADGAIRVWDVNSDNLLHVLREEEDSSLPRTFRINAVQFSPDGKWLAGADALHRIVIWDAADGARERILKGHTDDVMSLCFSPDGRLLASGGKDLSLRVWSVRDGNEQDVAANHSDLIDTVWFSPDGKRLATGCTDRVLRMWDLADAERGRAPRQRLQPTAGSRGAQLLRQGGAIRTVSIAPDGGALGCAGDDRHVYVWSLRESRLRHAIGKHREPIRCLDFSPDGACIATGSEDRTIRLWSAENGQLLRELVGHESRVTAVHFSSTRNLLVSSSEDRSLRLWLTGEGKFIYAIRGPFAPIHAARFSPDGELLAAACEDQCVWVWSARDGQAPRLSKRLEGHTSGVTTLQFSPNGVWLASGGKDNHVRLWRVGGDQHRSALSPLDGHSDRITSLAFSPASSPLGPFLASGGSDGAVCIWELESGRLIKTLSGHLGEVHGIAVTPNAKGLIAAGFSGRVQFWDLESGETVLHRYGIGPDAWLDVLPDGRFNASAEGRRYLCYTEQGALYSHTAETLLTEFYDPNGVQAVLNKYVD